MSLSLEGFRNSEDEPDQPDDTIAEPPPYGFIKRWLDRRAARRDARSGIPVYSKQQEPTPFVEDLIAECVQLVAAETQRWARETARLRNQVAKLTTGIQEAERDLNPDNCQQATYHGVATGDLAIVRRNAASRANRDELGRIRERLRSHRIQVAGLNADIDSLYEQYLGLLNQIVSYSWRRISTYRSELIRVHPDGDRLSTSIKWGPAELAKALVKSGEIKQQLILLSESQIAITSGKKGKED